MDYNETLDYIHSLGRFSMPASLERIKKVLSSLGNPQNSFKTIHIAGTNGKGSVSAMISSVLKTAGIKTGLFISPYIINFRERIQINGEYISENDLCYYAKRVKDTKIALTEFEFITAVAFLYFADKKIEILVCETGLGGRFDATNATENKIACAITKIGLDHTAILGDTIQKIAYEKCGILRDCPTITNPYQEREALFVIKDCAKNLVTPDVTKLEIIKNDFANICIYNGEKYTLNLLGDYQIENLLTAIETIKNCGLNISYEEMYKGIIDTYIPVRMEKVSNDPIVIIDGAHNPDGATALIKELKKCGEKATCIVGMCKDKNYEEFLKTTLQYAKNVVVVEIENNPRTLSLDEIFATASKYSETEKAGNYEIAIEMAKRKADKNPIFIFGSLYLASGIRPYFIEN